jgi:hypothetical protein
MDSPIFYPIPDRNPDRCERLECGWKISWFGKLVVGFTYFPRMEGLFMLSIDELDEDERALFERLGPLFEQERLRMARALAKGALLGKKEFELRDQVHDLGAKALEAAADERQKKGWIRRS